MKQMVFGIMRDLDAECAAWNKRHAIYALASRNQRQNEIARICAMHELESDEFMTREQKAIQYLNTKR